MKISVHWCLLKNSSSVLTVPIVSCCLKSGSSVHPANPLNLYSQLFICELIQTLLGLEKNSRYVPNAKHVSVQNHKAIELSLFYAHGDRYLGFFLICEKIKWVGLENNGSIIQEKKKNCCLFLLHSDFISSK